MEIISGSAGVGKTRTMCGIIAGVSMIESVTVFTSEDTVASIKNKILSGVPRFNVDSDHNVDVVFVNDDSDLINKVKESDSSYIFIDGAVRFDNLDMINTLNELEKETGKSIITSIQTKRPSNTDERAKGVSIETYVKKDKVEA